MTAFPKYPRYKDSGVEWLGNVPEHWEVEKGLRYFFETESRSLTGDEELLSVSHLTGVTPRSEKNITMFMAESYEGSKLCDVGDIAVNTMWAWMAALGVSRYRGLVSPSYGTYRQNKPERFNPTFLDHLIRMDVYRSHYTVNSTGITTSRLRLYPHSFLRLKFVCPPRAEQDRIVAFLDEKTAQIDALIAKKQRQIELLDEQKAILINRAVTRGLHPNPDLQDSGIDWIGQIPAHWKVVSLRYLLSEPLTNGLFKTKQFFGEGTPLVNVGDVYAQDNLITPSDLERVRANTRERASYRVLKGDIFFVRSSLKLEGTGASSMMPDCIEETVFECHVIRGRPKANMIEPEYLIRYLNAASVRNALVADAKTVTMSTLDQQAFLRLPVLVPPKEEQEPICAALRAMFGIFNQAKKQIESQIQTLQTLRSTLIAHAVTGKIKI